MAMTFEGWWINDDTDALDETCTVSLPDDPFTPSDADGFGIGGAFQGTPSTVSLSCMLVPSKEVVNRETGRVVLTPVQLLIQDESTQVEDSSRITYQTRQYEIDTLKRDGNLVLVTLKRG